MLLLPSQIETYYGLITLFLTILHNVFLIYYVEVFIYVYKINEFYFWIGQGIFLTWNCINDPLFGWISDSKYLFKANNSSEHNVIRQRLHKIRIYGPLLAVSFMFIWIPVFPTAIQFIFSLCLYDTFLTMVDLHHSALLADLTTSSIVRANLNYFCSIFSAIGSISIYFSYLIWENSSYRSFQLFCFVLATFSTIGFHFATRLLSSVAETNKPSTSLSTIKPNNRCSSIKDLYVFIKQLFKHKNFLLFALINLIQVFHCHFNSNFFPLFINHLLSTKVYSFVKPLLLSVSFMIPHLNNLYMVTLCKKFGVYSVIKFLFLLKIFMGLTMVALGADSVIFLCIFIASNRVFTEGICKLESLVIGDLVDEDFVLHKRHQPVSALLFGTVSFVSKPGQSIAPLVGTCLLKDSGIDLFRKDIFSKPPDEHFSDLSKITCFSTLVYVPIICGLLQYFIWTFFSLHGDKLNKIRILRHHVQDLNV